MSQFSGQPGANPITAIVGLCILAFIAYHLIGMAVAIVRARLVITGVKRLMQRNRMAWEAFRPQWLKHWQEDREKGEVLAVVYRQQQEKRKGVETRTEACTAQLTDDLRWK